ncbi:MAG: hypothetical protein Q8Q48_04595 [Candidatus Staskawiczbacteria bacterium]|nr:hypothetical protein [Candidatus Staskawiczbacteria bacterium]
MGCCGTGSHEPKQNNDPLAVEKSDDSPSLAKKILTWGVAVVTIIALLAWLF